MNITILGPGAIGSLWAVKLSKAGHSVSLWSRSTSPSTLLSLDEEQAIAFNNNNIQNLEAADLVLVTVKAWQVESAIAPLLKNIHPDAILVFMHNGMGALDSIEHSLADRPVVIATTTQAAFKPSSDNVNHTGMGQTQLGSFNAKGSQCQFLVNVFNHALPEVVWNSKIQTALWTKLAINCAINPLTGLNQVKNGELANQEYSGQLSAVIRELVQVMNAEHIQCDYQQLHSSIYNVINTTSANNSSMKQDIHFQRPTEIEFITGYLIKIATKHSISVPVNTALYNQIKQQEQNWLD
ncbi:2-dehydropantoate 2-reductase [Vibrio makurazakiensis]|uniref:2-dehydropantoate 2-reductase n=1 Tax=Vibrio makurazakiensis TaxID=2910250 RepID=UPI003D127E45